MGTMRYWIANHWRTVLISLFIVVGMTIFIASGFANLNDVKAHACDRWKELGYECAGYEGYQWGMYYFVNGCGGARVWHTLKRTDTPGIVYMGFVQKWGDEYHVYNITAVNAVSTPR